LDIEASSCIKKNVRAECDLQAAEYAEAGGQESGRILIAYIEEIVDPPEGREIFVDLIIRRKIDECVSRRGEPWYREIAIAVDKGADEDERCRKRKLVDRFPSGLHAELVARPAQQFEPG
jgi:hypothetical protein